MDAIVVMTTCDSQDEARRIAAGLLEARLAACVQRTAIQSSYVWQGRVHDDAEILLLIKTAAARYDDIERWLTEHHSYDEPEIVAVPVVRGAAGYLGWLGDATG